jgi:dihydrofolate reductase
MKRTIHIATSLDGFVADIDNGIQWLNALSTHPETSARILPFIASVDGTVMGRITYETCLAFPEWPFPGKHCLVVTRSQAQPATPTTTFVLPQEIVARAEALGIEKLWIVGGGQLNGYMISRGWVDELIVTVAPILLGKGESLAPTLESHQRLHLREVHPLADGFVELCYGLRQN